MFLGVYLNKFDDVVVLGTTSNAVPPLNEPTEVIAISMTNLSRSTPRVIIKDTGDVYEVVSPDYTYTTNFNMIYDHIKRCNTRLGYLTEDAKKINNLILTCSGAYIAMKQDLDAAYLDFFKKFIVGFTPNSRRTVYSTMEMIGKYNPITASPKAE